ncbi:hypothetical protein QTP88_021756 [Uroleucon formosanum]
MKYDFAMENCLGTDYPNLHELNKNCYGFSPASVQNGPQAAAAAAAADEQTMYKGRGRKRGVNKGRDGLGWSSVDHGNPERSRTNRCVLVCPKWSVAMRTCNSIFPML